MMYRSQWATSSNQQRILAIWPSDVRAFESYLARAAHTQHDDSSENDEKQFES